MSVIENMLLAKNAKSWLPSDASLDVEVGQLPEKIWQVQNQRVKTDINKSRLELANQFRQNISRQISLV